MMIFVSLPFFLLGALCVVFFACVARAMIVVAPGWRNWIAHVVGLGVLGLGSAGCWIAVGIFMVSRS